MTVTTKYNEVCKHFKDKLQSHGIQPEHDIYELVSADKHEYFENA